jgi:hypothetical protein
MIEFDRDKCLWLKEYLELNEKWVQELIAKDPSILGLVDDLEPRAHRVRAPLVAGMALSSRQSEISR